MMTVSHKLLLIKISHTVIWLFFNVVIFYILYAAITNHIDYWVWIGIGLVVIEGLVLTLFNMYCPLTLLAKKYSNSTRANFDIFLPNLLAKHNKVIYTTIFSVAVALVIYRVVNN